MRPLSRHAAFLALLAAVVAGSVVFAAEARKPRSRPPQRDPFADLPSLVEKAMTDWQVPGLAIGVVKDGKAIYMRGFGYREIDRKLPVTPQTLFRIGSITKSFTALAVAQLVDKGKLEWDAPVINYLPEFRLYDEYATLHATPRDLLSHRTGLPGHYAMVLAWPDDRHSVLKGLRYLEPTAGFRARYQYGNLTYGVIGELVERISGVGWEEYVARQVFDPLGMKSTTVGGGLESSEDSSLPYEIRAGQVVVAPYVYRPALSPAGGIVSNVADMVSWLNLQLSRGKVGERVLVSPETLKETHSPHIAVSYSPGGFTGELQDYGMGWNIQPYRGHYLLHHGGWLTGYASWASFIPGERIGIVILSNRATLLPYFLMYTIYDRLLGVDRDWVKILEANKPASTETQGGAALAGVEPNFPLETFSGVYRHPAYGQIRIQRSATSLNLRLNDQAPLPLTHVTYNTFQLEYEGSKYLITFHQGTTGQIERISIPWEEALDDAIYVRVADESLRDAGFLKTFVGEYEYQGLVIVIELRDEGTLAVKIPGQPEKELVPVTRTMCKIKGDEHTRVEFRFGAGGEVLGATVYGEEGSLEAVRRK